MNSSQSLFDIPWVEKHRPTTLKSIVGNDSIITSLINISNVGNLPNLILSGPPGIGKTTSIMALAKTLLGDNFKKATLELNASDDRGINVVREKIKNFAMQKIPLPPNLHKIVILDEADNMTPSAQSSLRVIISDYGSTTRFCFACNDSSKIIEPIQSRCSIIRFSKLKSEEIKNRLIQVLNEENVNYDDDGIDSIVETSNGDMRYALNNAQSTFVGFGFINRENVYKIVDVPKPEIISKVVKLCYDGKFNECCSVVDNLINDGETQVGKTAIITQFTENRFEEEYVTTMNSDKIQKEVEISNGKQIKIEIWDTIGQIGYRAVNKIFMKSTKIAIIVYDITNQKTFDVLKEFYDQVIDVNGKDNVMFVVVGNKSDLYEDQVVTKEAGEEYAKSIEALFFETSATDHECIENLFKDVIENYVKTKMPVVVNEPEKKDDNDSGKKDVPQKNPTISKENEKREGEGFKLDTNKKIKHNPKSCNCF